MCRIFKPNDWYPVWATRGIWDNKLRNGWEYPSYCNFEILHSPSRKKYKLRTRGENPKEHSVYKIAVQKLNEFINGRQA